MKKTITIDLGTITGIAYFEDNELKHYFNINLNKITKKAELNEKIKAFGAEMRKIKRKYKPDLVAFEALDYSPMSVKFHFNNIKVQLYFEAMVRSTFDKVIWYHNMSLFSIVSTIARKTRITRYAKKTMVLKYINKKYNLELNTTQQDIADAILVFEGCKKWNWELKPISKETVKKQKEQKIKRVQTRKANAVKKTKKTFDFSND